MAEKKYENAKATKSSNKAFVPWPNANKNKSSSSSKSNGTSTRSSVSKKSSTSSSSKKNSRVEQAKATRVEKDLEISVPSNSKVSKKVTKELTKKTNKPLVISIVLCLVIGIVLGYFCLVYLCKNDCFEMNVDALKSENVELFFKRFNNLLKINNTNINRVSKHTSINRNCIYHWQNKHLFPKLGILIKLSIELHTNIEYLIGRTDVMEISYGI